MQIKPPFLSAQRQQTLEAIKASEHLKKQHKSKEAEEPQKPVKKPGKDK